MRTLSRVFVWPTVQKAGEGMHICISCGAVQNTLPNPTLQRLLASTLPKYTVWLWQIPMSQSGTSRVLLLCPLPAMQEGEQSTSFLFLEPECYFPVCSS